MLALRLKCEGLLNSGLNHFFQKEHLSLPGLLFFRSIQIFPKAFIAIRNFMLQKIVRAPLIRAYFIKNKQDISGPAFQFLQPSLKP